MNILFYDLETTGFDRRWDSVIEIAGVIYNMEENRQLDTFHEYIKPHKSIPANITQLTGITNEMVEFCRSEASVLKDFSIFVMGSPIDAICGHNCKAFDNQFMAAKADRYGLPWNEAIEGKEIIDTLALARQFKKQGKINTPNLKQPTLAGYYGIEYAAHSALEDVLALIEIYQAMTNYTINREELGF